MQHTAVAYYKKEFSTFNVYMSILSMHNTYSGRIVLTNTSHGNLVQKLQLK